MNSITLVQLEYLVSVAEYGHFGRAAAACCVTQPTLSMQIQKAEQQLGAVLFDRSRTPVVPTDVGRKVVAQARVVLREAARLAELCSAAEGMVAGVLRVGVLPTLGPYLMPQLVSALAERYPQLQVVLEELQTEVIVERLREESLDIGLVATPHVAADLLQWPLFSEPLLGYVHAQHALAGHSSLRLAELPPEDVWLLSEAHCLGQLTRDLCHLSGGRGEQCLAFGRTFQFESGSIEMLKQLVAHNGGLTLLPALSVEPRAALPDMVRLIPFAAPAPARHVSLACRRAYVKQHAVAAFAQLLLATLPGAVALAEDAPAAWRAAR